MVHWSKHASPMNWLPLNKTMQISDQNFPMAYWLGKLMSRRVLWCSSLTYYFSCKQTFSSIAVSKITGVTLCSKNYIRLQKFLIQYAIQIILSNHTIIVFQKCLGFFYVTLNPPMIFNASHIVISFPKILKNNPKIEI